MSVSGVAQSRTQLKRLISSSACLAQKKIMLSFHTKPFSCSLLLSCLSWWLQPLLCLPNLEAGKVGKGAIVTLWTMTLCEQMSLSPHDSPDRPIVSAAHQDCEIPALFFAISSVSLHLVWERWEREEKHHSSPSLTDDSLPQWLS